MRGILVEVQARGAERKVDDASMYIARATGITAAFLVPLSETLVRLWEMSATGELWRQFASSALLFVTGLALALTVGMPLGMLLARMRALRVAIEPYITILYATPMVALMVWP